MSHRPSVLFVCTGNIFRSMTAEFALKSRAEAGRAIQVSSAGLEEAPHGVLNFVSAHLKRRGFDVSGHRPRLLTEDILTAAGLAIAMGFDHRDQIDLRFGRRVPLFSEVAFGVERPLPDVWEAVPDWRTNEAAARRYGEEVIDTIVDAMPDLVCRLDGFLASPIRPSQT